MHFDIYKPLLFGKTIKQTLIKDKITKNTALYFSNIIAVLAIII